MAKRGQTQAGVVREDEELPPSRGAFRDGRDELNLADFPVSVLQRQQPVDDDGKKLDTAVYDASRYDPNSKRRVRQRVVLETSSRHGLPTPADENVILALLYVGKHADNFADPVVRFSPRQLFRIMGWSPNSRSYDRLRDVLRRLQALVIRYENSWWDIAGRAYEAEVATGIISEYELGRQVGGRKTGAETPPCWVRWAPHFYQSLSNGNLKKLDLERLFALRLPTSQRMYRFLDKRFYPPLAPPPVEMDLHDFAFGHIGLTRIDNVAELKRRLAPAIAELEEIGFIAPAPAAERYLKVQRGLWRVRFTAGPNHHPRVAAPAGRTAVADPSTALSDREPGPAAEVVTPPDPDPWPFAGLPPAVAPTDGEPGGPALRPPNRDEEEKLAAAFYRSWDGRDGLACGENDRRKAADILATYPIAEALELVPLLVQVVRRRWPDCRSFSGAVGKYLPDAIKLFEARRQRATRREEDRSRQRQDRTDHERQRAEDARLEAAWLALPDDRRQEIEDEVVRRFPEHRSRPAVLRGLCLKMMAGS